jgi:hypothetical protein
VPSDFLKGMDWYAGVSEPRQRCMPQVVPSQLIEAELSHDFILLTIC